MLAPPASLISTLWGSAGRCWRTRSGRPDPRGRSAQSGRRRCSGRTRRPPCPRRTRVGLRWAEPRRMAGPTPTATADARRRDRRARVGRRHGRRRRGRRIGPAGRGRRARGDRQDGEAGGEQALRSHGWMGPRVVRGEPRMDVLRQSTASGPPPRVGPTMGCSRGRVRWSGLRGGRSSCTRRTRRGGTKVRVAPGPSHRIAFGSPAGNRTGVRHSHSGRPPLEQKPAGTRVPRARPTDIAIRSPDIAGR